MVAPELPCIPAPSVVLSVTFGRIASLARERGGLSDRDVVIRHIPAMVPGTVTLAEGSIGDGTAGRIAPIDGHRPPPETVHFTRASFPFSQSAH